MGAETRQPSPWRVVGGIVTEAVILDEDPWINHADKPREVELRHLKRNGDDWITRAVLDTSFRNWRDPI